MAGTLVIVNPNAASGKAGRLWSRLEPLMYQTFGDLVVAITEHTAQVGEHLDKARDAGLTRIIAVGGDGTSHSIINALLTLQERDPSQPRMTFGQLPIGTGQDFARALGIPLEPEGAIPWLAKQSPRPIDVGLIDYNGQREFFLNIASVGVSGEVDRRVHGVPRRPWTFWLATVRSFLTYRQPAVRVQVDGALWYEGRAWLVAAANGSTFGRGMAIAPHAQVDDGQFDVVLVKAASRLTALRAFNTVYSGAHLGHPSVDVRRGQAVEVTPLEGPLMLDLDGEPALGGALRFSLHAGALQMLYGGL